jgi:hypothetical protein
MVHNLRKLSTALISLATLLAIYLVYSQISKTPQIDIDSGGEFAYTIAHDGMDQPGGEVGKIGGVGVVTLEKPRYLHRNQNNEIDREFGFEELLHEEKDHWEVRKPYVNIYQPSFKCYITADEGQVQVETAAGRTSPKDAMFTGNVVIRIAPEKGSDIKESFIYLDDIVFLSEKSLFSTAGPIRFASEDARMFGTGLEIIYNDQSNRLEYFRIVDLESLHFRSSQEGLFAQTAKAKRDPAIKTQLSSNEADADSPGQTTSSQRDDRGQGEYYRCVFGKNVVIETPDQRIFADDRVALNNIFWSTEPSNSSKQGANPDANDADVWNVASEEASEPNELRGDFGDIVITCDGGLTITPMDLPEADELPADFGDGTAISQGAPPEGFDNAAGRQTCTARRIDYDDLTGQTAITGPLTLTFDVNMSNLADAEGQQTLLPVKLTAQKEGRFYPTSNRVVLEGDCLATMLWEEPNVQRKYSLSGETFIVDLAEDANDHPTPAANIEHLTVYGGTVTLATIKTAAAKFLGGIQLKCRKFDYDAIQQFILATGPGMVTMDNSKVAEPVEKVGRFSLRRPCYAFLQHFDTLQYFLGTDRVIADAVPEAALQINYFPAAEVEYDQWVVATAAHTEAAMAQTPGGQTELSTLFASGAITYEDQDNQFAGSELFYDHGESTIKVSGDEFQPCYFNGALVERVEYNPQTRKVGIQIAAPGALQLER